MPRPRPTVGSTTGLTGTSGTSGGSPTISGGPVPAGSIIPASLKTTPTSPTGAGQVLGYDGTGFAWVAPGGSSAAVLTNRGVWAVSTSYAVGDVVVNGSTTYACTTSHTSGVTFSGTNWVALGSTAGGLASITITGTPSAGQVLQATSSTAATWVTPTSPQSTLGTIQTAASTPVTGRVNRYDASSGALSLTMPAVAAAGGSFSVQKTDSSTNTVTIGGVTLDKPKALVEFVSDGTVWAQVNASTGSPQTPDGGSGLGSVTVSGTPTAGQVLTASSGTAASWSTPASGAGDATTAAKGVVQLAGDLGGTASAPTVPGLAGKYTKPGPGIPATDLTAAVQSAVAAAGTAVQSVNGKTGTSVTLNASDVGAVASVVGQTGAVTGAQIAADPALTGTYAAGLTVPAPTGVSATDSAAVQAAHDALPATGGTLTLQRGDYNLTAGVTFTKPTTLVGQGMGGFTAAAPTRVLCTSATAIPITIASEGSGLRDLAIVNTAATPTAGAGVAVTSGDNLRITRVKVLGFYDGIDVTQGRYQCFTECSFFDSVRYGLYLRNTTVGQFDFGDISVMGCTFAALTTSRIATDACRWESGGGLRFIDNKTNGNYNTLGQSQTTGLTAAVADGGGTSVLIVMGNSFEGIQAGGAPVVVTHSGTGTGSFSKVIIVGNESLAGAGIRINGVTTGKFSNILIANNVITGAENGIYVKNAKQVTIGRNNISGLPSTASAVWIDTGCTDYTVEPQDIDTATNVTLLRDDSAVTTTAGVKVGNTATYQRGLPAITSAVTYVNLLQAQFNANTGAVIEFEVYGIVSGVGGFAWSAKRVVAQGAAGTTPVLSTVGTDVASANTPDVQIDGTANQTVTLKARLGGSGTAVTGTATMKVNGIASRVWKL